ncbi:Centromere-associated protein E [Stylophora pistillata]|uniref:Centromere-associated protein E n=1 Tax=Stylophora pistillata TaxID=50429 RepID=A0A2B4RRA9_STYPI|nr:Centromere-associated protein E [Stylophora pistillata]
MAATDNIRVAIRVRPLIKRENDFHQPIHWKVDGNTITQLANGKILPNSSYFFDRIFDMSSSTQDVYDEFGRPTVLSAMDGFNGTLFAYGQTSSGKTHTMMGDGNCQGVIPKAIGEIFDYIEKNPSREFLIRVSYIEIYNEDIKDLLNPARTNLKIHENAEKQVYVGELTEEVVSCSEDVFKHMMRGEKNRHFGVTNMNDRSSRSHTIFRVVIESREMMDESKAPDTIDGAVRVAHLNLVDLAGSERASQTGAFGQRLKEGGHINKSLLALGSVIAKLSEGESFIPFRDSKLTRILQSSLGGNAKTSMLCTITPAAIEESISTLKFASRAKTIKNCPEVNEVLDDGTLLKRYRKEIRELKQQLVQMSSSSHVQELQLEKEKVNEMEEMLEQQRRQQNEQEEKIKRLCNMICTAGGETANNRSKAKLTKRRETWCPGAGLSKAPLATSAAFSSVKSRLQRIPSSPSSDESEFGEMTKDIFLSTLEEEEDIKSSESGKKRVVFASPAGKRCLSSTTDLKKQEHKEMQTEPDQNCMEMEREVKRLRSDLHEAIETRDFYNELLEESNALLEKMSTENGRNDTPTTQVSMLKTLDQLRAKNKELQAEFDSVQAEKESLAARVEGLENAGTFNTAAQMNADSLQMALDEGVQERDRLCENLKEWQKKCTCRESDVARLQGKITNAGQEGEQYSCQQEASERIRQLELQVKEMGERLSGVKEQERRLTEAIEEKVQLEESKKLEVACLEEALDEMTKEKGRLDETLQLWKDKCAILETIVALSKEEKPSLEEKMASAREEASVKIKKLEEQVKEMEDRLKSVDGQEGMLTEVIEQKLQLEENHKVEVTSLKKTLASLEGALDEVTKEKGRLDEALQQWKDKCASLETNEALSKEEKLCLEEKMAFVGEEASEKIRKLEEQVKEMEESEEKLRLEEKMTFAGEEASQKIRELENQVMEMKERLASVDEQEGMLTEVIEQKLQLEENHKVEVTSLKKALEEIAQEKESIESWKEKCASLESDLRRLQEEITCVERERERSKLEESLSIVKEDTSVKMKEMGKGKLSNEDENKIMLAEVTEQRVNLEDIVTPLETDAAQGKELSEQTRNIKACFEQFKEEKDEEIMQLKKDIQELQDERNITSCGVEEKDTLLEQIIEQKQELEAKMSDLQVQLENVINEKEEYEQLLIQVKKEKDEIKNDLSESISDSAELQKDMLEMQQKVKRYKEHIYELENELRLRAELITSHEQKCEELQNRLSEALKQLQNVSQDMNKKLLSEGQVPDEQHEKETDADDEKFTSELSAEKERAQEIADECNALKLSLENVQNRNGILESEVEETKQEVEKKLKQLKSLELQLVESKQAYDLCEEQLKEQRDKCEELVKELNEMKSTECQSKKLSGSFSSELELHKAKRENEELLKELGEEKKTHEMLRKEHTSVLEELQHFKDSLLRDTNRGMDQQRLIDKMKAERRETICVQAQQRHELENDLCEAQKKDSTVEELNSTIRVKHEELEHMTFLLDEKEVEIAEVTTTLQQKELKQSEMTEESRRNEGKINELEKELEYVNESLLEVKKSRVEAEAKIGELKGIIRQQEAELISVNKKMETLNGENESQSQELALKTEQFEKELEDMQHRLLEVESELEFTKSSLENVDAEKKDLNTRVEKALKEKELFDEKLYELTASFDNQKNALDQEIDEIRESLLKEKNIVSELEDKLLVAEKTYHQHFSLSQQND